MDEQATTQTSGGSLLVRRVSAMHQNQVGAVFGLLWLLLTLAVIRALISAELASAATQLQQSTDGGADAAHQV